MFMHATNPELIKGDIVILANADQAFDSSVQWARHINDNTVLVLPTWGFGISTVPSATKEFFELVYAEDPEKFNKEIPSRCVEEPHSWDGFVFHRKLIEGQLDPEHFQRPTTMMIGDEWKPDFFRMNEMGAEAAALWALLENVPLALDVNGCSVIQMWHFHGAPKMHARGSGEYYWYWGEGSTGMGGTVPEPFRHPDKLTTGYFMVEPPQKSYLEEAVPFRTR